MEEEVLESSSKPFSYYLHMVARRKWLVLAVTLPVILLFIASIFIIEPTYRAQATILIEEQDVPSSLVQTTVTSYAVQRIEEIKQKIMTNSNIISIAEQFDLYTEDEFEKLTRSEISHNFRSSVSVSPISAEVIDPRSGRPGQAVIAFSLAFKGRNAQTVHKVTNELVTLFLNENLKERAEQSESTSEFLESEANSLNQQLKTYEKSIAEFKEKNKGSLPELKTYNLNVIDRSQNEILNIETRIQDLEVRKIGLQSKLLQISPSAPQVLANGQNVLGVSDRIKALKSEYNKKKSLYHKDHPDLVRLKREIEALSDSSPDSRNRSDLAKELELLNNNLEALLSKYNEEHPEVVSLKKRISDLEKGFETSNDFQEELIPDNPSYILIATQLESIESEISALRNKQSELRKKIDLHEALLKEAPSVEKDYAALLRDYENTRLKYREIKAKLMSADLAKNLEQEQKGERFTLIQPPERPEEPISPNKKIIIFLGIIVGLAAGIGAAFVADLVDQRVYGYQSITELLPEEPLVSIPFIKNERNKRALLLTYIIGITSLLLLLVVALCAIHFLYEPLDVLWYVLLRKFDI